MSGIGRRTAMELALLAPAGCQIAGEAPTATTQTGANGEDVDFVTNAYQLIMFDREEGALATSEAMDPRVRVLAAKMVTDANQLAAKLGPLAAAEGIRPPDILRYSLRIRLGHMRLQNGLDFDRTFVDDQVASHQEAISMHEMMAGSGGSPALRQLAQEISPIVRDNLRQLQALQLEMMRR